MAIKGIVFFDVDGTLIDVKKGIESPTNSTKESINKLKENGYLTLIATGRPKNSIGEDLTGLGVDGYVTSNGSYAELDGKVIFNECIDNSLLKDLLDFLEENNLSYMLEGQEKNYIKDFEDKKIMNLIKTYYSNLEGFSIDWDKDKVKINKIIAIINDENSFDLVNDKYSKLGFATQVVVTKCGPQLEIFNGKYTKGYGVTHLLESFNIDKNISYAFGDGENDIEMFQAVKYSMAMGGYDKGLEAYASNFTENVENEGITKGLENLGII